MKKYFVLLLTLLLSSVSLADKVTEQEALQKAQKFFKDKRIISRNLSRGSKAEQQPNASPEDYYVFNAEDKGGFVIISGDDRTPEVLGYADSGNLDLDNLPPNLKGWLEGYSKQIKAIKNSNIAESRATSRTVTRAPKDPIAPLLTTKWGQDYPYNMNCPEFFDERHKCVTGCVATAMAQVMYYHRAKSTIKTTATIPSYIGSTYWLNHGLLTIDEIPEGAIIDWDNMLNRYSGSETDVQKEAVANLMLYCGTSVKMDYGFLSSAYSFDVPAALKQYFDYSENTTLVYRHNYTEEDWDELIYSELNKSNPIYYGGSNSEAGHAFVCDGYDGNGYYHINWGWDGLSDSFFLLSALNPNQQGTGGSSAGYNDGQYALIGAVPNGDIMRLSSQSVSLTGNTSFFLSETGDNITVPVRWEVQNTTGTSCNFDHAIGLYFKGELVKILKETGSSEMFTANQEKTIDASLIIETNHSLGIYQLYALSRSQGEEKWFRNENSSDCYITLVIKHGSMSFYVGKPAAAENVINFADDEVKRICVENWDTDGDGEISYDEAAAVTNFGSVFDRSIIKTFDEAQYFTGITSFGIVDGSGGCSSLVSIKIPTSATSIRSGGFCNCKALTSIDIPASIKEIEKNAFYGCSSLQEVSLHEGLESIDHGAFYDCALSSVSIPASVSYIGKYPWGHCSNLNEYYVDDNNLHYCSINGVLFTKDQKNLVCFPCKREGIYNIPSGTEKIYPGCFSFSTVENIVIPESLKSIGENAFTSMNNLQEFTIPSSITSIGEGIFWGCHNLKSVVLESNISEVPRDMFIFCLSLNNISLPKEITSIGACAFYGCIELSEITIPSKVTCIGDSAFLNTDLNRVTSLMEIPCTISSKVFEGTNVYYTLLYVPEQSLEAYNNKDNWNRFSQILPIGEKGIEAYAELNNGVLTFYYDTNRDVRNGMVYDISRQSPKWANNNSIITNVVFDTSFANARPITTGSWFSGCKNLIEIQGIENLTTNEVTDMGFMFYDCRSITSIDLCNFNTNKVTKMTWMFTDCNNLKTVKLPNDLKFIDSGQFMYCYSLTELTIPSSVASIGYNAFSYSRLAKVTSHMKTPCSINSSVFENINADAILYVPEESLDAYKDADYWKDFSHILPIDKNGREPYVEYYNGVLSFYYDTKREERNGLTYDIPYGNTFNTGWDDKKSIISKVIFDASFTEARPTTTYAWFDGCEKLTEIQGIENLNTSEVTDMSVMFQNCHSLETLDLSSFKTSKVTSMHGMFFNCGNLKSVVLPNGLTFIDTYLFISCNSLKEVLIPSSITSIGEYAYQYCTSMNEITIPASVTSIGDNAFSYSGLTKVTSLMQTPCGISSTVFEDVSNNATLYVPAGCKAAYEAADHWKDFKKIMGPSSNLIYMVDGEEYRSYEIEHGSAITPEPAPSKEGYTFSGWSEIPEIMPAKDVTITSSFNVNKYNLIYKVDDNDYKTYNVEYGSTIIPEESPTKEGYAFSGWSEIPETMPCHDVEVNGRFYMPGDANGDGVVNIADIVEIVNFINNKPSDNFDELAANVTSDDKINDDDIAAILNIIMK